MEQNNNNAAQEAVKEEKFENVGGETTQQEPKWYHKTGAYVAEKACNTFKITKENPVEVTVIAVVTGAIYWGIKKMFASKATKED